MSTPQKKLILVIGATGAQGLAVIDALLAPAKDGSPSPYAIRALTRDPSHRRAQELAAKGVQLAQGRFDDTDAVRKALSGCYGVWVNTDGFTVGEAAETFSGIRIFELAKQTPSLRHYVYSGLEYALALGNYKQEFKCDHYDGKARVIDWMHVQRSVVSNDEMSWSVVLTGPYMDMLDSAFAPVNKREDGTFVFVSPVGDGHIPMIALVDLGYFARYTFDHRQETSGKDLPVASDLVGVDYLAETFTKVTGHPAVYKRLSIEEWWTYIKNADAPVAHEKEGSTTIRSNFSAFWRLYRDDLVKRDMDWIRSINPETRFVEKWMRENNYKGGWLAGASEGKPSMLKNMEDGSRAWSINTDLPERTLL